MPVSVVAAWVFCAFVAILTAIQVAAIAGAPLGAYLWGGETPGKLSPKLRRSSVISVLIYLVFVVLVLNRVAVLQLFSGFWAGFAAWVVFVFITLGLIKTINHLLFVTFVDQANRQSHHQVFLLGRTACNHQRKRD